MVLSKEEGKLVYRFEKRTEEIELKPESENKFFSESKPDVQIEFEIDQFGAVSRTYFIVHGMKNEIEKLF